MIAKLTPIAGALAIALTLAACGGGSSDSSSSASSAPASSGAMAAAPGSITAAGSTALLPLVKQAAADYETKNPAAKIAVSGGGSGTGITQVANKGIDIGDSDIPAPSQPSLVDHEVAIVSFAVVANPKSGVKNLTSAQVRDIFTGKVTNFKQVGGADQAISVINRPPNSGTRAVFAKTFMGGAQPIPGAGTQDSSGTVASMVSQTPGAVSYLATSYIKGGNVTAVSIDGVTPTDANVTGGKYKYWSYEHMFTNGQPSKSVGDFIEFVKNDKTALAALGFIPVGAMKTK